MHPAYSVIFFTTASGAGYGLLILLCLASLTGLVAPRFWFGLVGLGLAFALIGGGLLSSTAHLGRPERAWRAFSQWRSSWLSREGVLAVATFVPAGVFAIGWVFLGRVDGPFAIAAALSIAGAFLTVVATAMIYASLKPIAQWQSPFTLPAYLILALMSGAALFNALIAAFEVPSAAASILALLLCLGAWALKLAAWRHNDRLMLPTTLNTATGLAGGPVRSMEWPHTQENYILKEMGYRVARKHAARLRILAQLMAFALPAILLAAGLSSTSPATTALSLLAVPIQIAGLLVERWLFFAEAKHTAAIYYGR